MGIPRGCPVSGPIPHPLNPCVLTLRAFRPNHRHKEQKPRSQSLTCWTGSGMDCADQQIIGLAEPLRGTGKE